MRLAFAAFFACSAILSAESSRCPEPRKPHLTSCTIFYNCMNLPGGGYVWVPSRCTEGLVFQPYLRMCVVPGDIWTCDTLSTDSTFVTERYETPELIDPTETSYLGYTQDPPDFSEAIDSSYAISDFVDSTIEAVTAQPLIEFEDSTRVNSGLRNVTYHKEENYLYEYNSQITQSPLMQKYKDIIDSHQKWLNDLITRLHIHKELSAAISASLSASVGSGTTTSPIQTITIFASHNRKQNISVNYQSHFEPNNVKPNEIDNVATTTDAVSTASTLDLLVNSLDPDNNVIRITDNLGNRRYLTINEYRVTAHRLSSRTVSVVACTKNVRLPNKTDCDRYYMCDPKTASVTEYSCPPHTAFNMYSRICDIESAKTCGRKLSTSEIFTVEREDATMHSEESSEEMLCKELGKIKDPASDSHYYICYNAPGSEKVKSIRMTCPNALIFCQSKKVCTVRRLCDVS
ncbi:uncharacterized protein [Linepithema humile]|uniref:uncharacterized protein n=1 Tax=Linepithema humile TaxID=83485 RepID=UPI00062383CF|nr:PREDICTED: uncharacterized protein LOC105676804 [Linepithema humile]